MFVGLLYGHFFLEIDSQIDFFFENIKKNIKKSYNFVI